MRHVHKNQCKECAAHPLKLRQIGFGGVRPCGTSSCTSHRSAQGHGRSRPTPPWCIVFLCSRVRLFSRETCRGACFRGEMEVHVVFMHLLAKDMHPRDGMWLTRRMGFFRQRSVVLAH